MFSPPDPDELSIEIDGTNFRFWSEIELNLRFDGFAAISFSAPFEPDNQAFREIFRPFTFKPVRVLLGGSVLFSGTMVDIVPQVTPDKKVVAVSAYSTPYVLRDCTPPASALPLEFSKLTLRQITEKLISPFGFSCRILGEDGSRFDRVALKPEEKIQGFLEDLAYQRGYVLSSDEEGNLLYRRSDPGTTPVVAELSDSQQPVIAVSATFSPQNYFSEVTCIAKTKSRRAKGARYTETNSFLDVLRPIVIKLDDTDPGDIQLATKAKLGRMFGNVASYQVDIATWFTPSGALYKPDMRIQLTAPSAMVYSQSELLIRTCQFRRGQDKAMTASLGLVLPGSFSGQMPSELPWAG